jgi:uncharacterized protein with GYD domain
MPTYLSLFVWTEQGVHDVINTGKRAADFRSRIQAGMSAPKRSAPLPKMKLRAC